MAKIQFPATLEEDLLKDIMKDVETGRFRNRSHAIEFYVNKGKEADTDGNNNG